MLNNKLVWFLGLIALFLVGDRLGAYILKSQVESSQFRYSRMYTGKAEADILLVGNSRGLTLYQPHIERVTGKSTLNISYNGMPMDLANVLVQDYFDMYPAPDMIILDITTCDRFNNSLISDFKPYMKYSDRLRNILWDSLPNVYGEAQVSHLFRYNSEVFQRALFYRNALDTNWINDRIIGKDLIESMDDLDEKIDVYPKLIAELVKIVDAAKAENVPVRLVVGPYFPGYSTVERGVPALIAAVEKATDLKVYDYSNSIADHSLFADFKHPNKAGSAVYVELMKRDSVLP